MNNWERLTEFLQGQREVTLVVHEKPDGDCLGSALALAFVLDKVGLRPTLFLPEKVPKLYGFLPGQNYLEIQTEGTLPKGQPLISVDCAGLGRIPFEIPASIPIFNIDHHISNTYFGEVNIVDTVAAATGEILYLLFNEGKIEIDQDIATCLYVALATDTGSFRFSNTTPATLRIASELLSLGSRVDEIRENLYEKRPLSELLTVKKALENIFISSDGRVISSTLSHKEMLDNNLLKADTDGIIGMMRSVEGVEVALLFKEVEPEEVRISFRSKSLLDVNVLAQSFGGGGHARAAGCTMKGRIQDIASQVIKRAEELLGGKV